jgi:intracellular septation protein
MTTQTSQPEKLTGWRKMAVEVGPLVPFLFGYFQPERFGPLIDQLLRIDFFGRPEQGVYVATVMFIPAYIIATAYSFWKERSLSPMQIMVGVLVIGLGVATLLFQSKIFYYMKSTFVYLLFAGVLGGGLYFNKIFLKMILGEAFHMPDAMWRTLTWRFVWMYLALAVGNEILWRTMTPGCPETGKCASEALYVQIETFGFMGLMFAFIIWQTILIAKYLKTDEAKEAEPAKQETVSLETSAASADNPQQKPAKSDD